MIKTFWKKLLKKDKMVLKKTDNELVRFVKQSTIIEERKRFEELMKREQDLRAKGLNDTEKKILYFRELENLDKRVYDKSYINDNVVDYRYLNDRKNYMPLGQKWRPFFWMPLYASKDDFSYAFKPRRIFFRIIGSIVMIVIGYQAGIWDGKAQTEKLKNNKVVEFESEEQIFDYLFNKNKTAVFLQIYNPGHWLTENWNKVFELESTKYEKEDVVFMRVHCRKHLSFCLSKVWNGRIFPAAEAYFINEEDQVEIADFNNKHRSAPGIEAFFEEQGIIESRVNPMKILERTGTKYLQIL